MHVIDPQILALFSSFSAHQYLLNFKKGREKKKLRNLSSNYEKENFFPLNSK
jgi:hypothetical protein